MAVPTSIRWQNGPDGGTPLNATQLNAQQTWIDERVAEAEAAAAAAQNAAQDASAPLEPVREMIGVDSAQHITPGASDDQAAELTAALNAAANHPTKTLVMRPGVYNFTNTVNIPEGVTLTGTRDVRLTFNKNATFLSVNASHVTVRGITLVGTNPVGGAATRGYEMGISAQGTSAAHIRGLRVENCTFEGFMGRAITTDFCDEFAIIGNRITDTGYCGIWILRSTDGVIDRNFIRGTGIEPAYSSGCYAIAITLMVAPVHPVDNPLPRRIQVTNNTIRNQQWEAIDTHGGENLVIANNVITASEAGVALTWKGGAPETGPQHNVIANNVIDGRGYPTERIRSGIIVNGAGDGSKPATVTITGNHVTGHGTSVAHAQQGKPDVEAGGIVVSSCHAAVISGNYVRDTRGYGIAVRLSHSAAVVGNVIHTVWREPTSTQLSSAVMVTNPTGVSIVGNVFRAESVGFSYQNERSINVFSGSPLGVYHADNVWADRPGQNISVGWVPLTLVNGWTAQSTTAVGVPAARRVGGVVYMRGRVSGGTAQTIASLPEDLRPAMLTATAVRDGSSTGVTVIFVNAAGDLLGYTGTTPNLAGLSWPLG